MSLFIYFTSSFISERGRKLQRISFFFNGEMIYTGTFHSFLFRSRGNSLSSKVLLFPFLSFFFRSFARYRKNFVSLPSLKRISRQVFKREIVSIFESLKNIATFLFLFRFEGRFNGNENYPSRRIVINLSNDCLSVFKPLNYAVI